MLTFMFIEKNGNGTLYLSASSYEEVLEKLKEKVKDVDSWRCTDEEGEDYDKF